MTICGTSKKIKKAHILHINDSGFPEIKGKSTYCFERLLDQAFSVLLK